MRNCWYSVFFAVGRFLITARFVIGGYALIYWAGAITLLLTLKMSSDQDGNLSISRESIAFKLAHPFRWNKGTLNRVTDDVSICKFYAQLVNVLIFIWPFLLLHRFFVQIVLSIPSFLLSGHRFTVDYDEAFGINFESIIDFWPGKVTVPVGLVFLLVYHRLAFIRFLYFLCTALWCALPLILIGISIGIVSYIWYKTDKLDGVEESIGIVAFQLKQGKARVCHKLTIK